MKFYEYTRLKRIEAGLTQQEIADKLGFSHRANAHKLETGKIGWSFFDVCEFAELLDMKPSELIAEWERQK
jgi:transcriptional regulator with XRE-family HTH domain